MRFEQAEARWRCPITLEGSFTSASFFKVRGSQVGQITRAASGTCVGDAGTALTTLTETLPWSIKYRLFRGFLPSITTIGIDIIGLSWQTTVELLTCLFRSTAEHPASEEVRLEGVPFPGKIKEWTTEETVVLRSSTLLCERQSLIYFGVGTMTRPGSSTAITIRLI